MKKNERDAPPGDAGKRAPMNPEPITPDPRLPLPEAVVQAVRPFIGPFEASTAKIIDNEAVITEASLVVLHPRGVGEGPVPIDSVAAVIVCEEELTVESLQVAYGRIQTVKALSKTAGMDVAQEMTIGLIVARDSHLPLETISDEIGRLTSQIPSEHWPDGVAVLSKGVVNYTARDPAGVAKAGDFFLPAQSLVATMSVPSVYIHRVIRATGNKTFNKVTSLLLARLGILEPGSGIRNFNDFLEGVPTHGVSTETYQFDLAYALRPMTVKQAVDVQLPRPWFEVSSGKDVLGSIQYLPWQDGAVLVVGGKLPIEMLLVFLAATKPEIKLEHLRCFRGPNVQVSYVVPMTPADFGRLLDSFQSRSNMRVNRRDPKTVVQKIDDEGTSTPFVARLMLGVMQIRDVVHDDTDSRLRFDELYEPILSGLREARESSLEIENLWRDHQYKVEAGMIARVQRGALYVDANIDRSLKRLFESFLNTAVRVIKQWMQELTEHHDIHIGFLFKKESTFKAAISELQKTRAPLADYLETTRNWSEPLVLMRNNLEHGIVQTPSVTYSVENERIRAGEPTVSSTPITEYTKAALDRICCFVEEITMFCLRSKFPQGLEITEVPIAGREANAPLRFNLCVDSGGLPPWRLSAHERQFDEA
jgi:hypothetical protein